MVIGHYEYPVLHVVLFHDVHEQLTHLGAGLLPQLSSVRNEEAKRAVSERTQTKQGS